MEFQWNPLLPGRIGIWKCWFLWRKTRSTRRETSRSKDENQQQTQPTYQTSRPEIEPRPHWWEATALTGHCAIPAP